MAKKKQGSQAGTPSDSVEAFMAGLEHPHRDVIEALRAIVSSADRGLTEGIKWNAPSYGLRGDDRVTFNLHDRSQVRLIFHCGAKPNARKGKGRPVDDSSGLLEWASDDRAIASFRNLEAVRTHRKALVKLVKQWLAATCET